MPKGLRFALMAMAPYMAVAIGLYGLHSAWVAILAYHAQILFWAWESRRGPADLVGALKKGWSAPLLLALGIPGVLLGPALWVLLEVALREGLVLGNWLERYGLSGSGWLLFVFYYGLLHPCLEQIHWDRLRRDRRGHDPLARHRPRLHWPQRAAWAHALFAGYHVLVLVLLLRPVWVAVSFAVLLAIAVAWSRVREHLGGLAVVAASHTIADAVLMAAVYLVAGRL